MKILIMLIAVLAHLFSLARSAMTFDTPVLAMNHLKVFAGKWMSSVAVGFASILSWSTLSSKQVYFTRNNFHVPWINTSRITAQMIDNQFIWDWAKERFIRMAMSTDTFLVNKENSVTVSIQRILPVPADRLRVNNIFALKTLF